MYSMHSSARHKTGFNHCVIGFARRLNSLKMRQVEMNPQAVSTTANGNEEIRVEHLAVAAKWG